MGGEVRVDLIGEIASTSLPIFRVDRVVNFVHDERNLRPIREVLDRGLCVLVQPSPLQSVRLVLLTLLVYRIVEQRPHLGNRAPLLLYPLEQEFPTIAVFDNS